jgi:hypothetical protein
MPKLTLDQMPGRSDINSQYSAGRIKDTLAYYKNLPPGAGGDYQFGVLTAWFCKLDPNDRQNWEESVRTYPQDVRDEIKSTIIAALSNKDSSGNDSPIPITFKWTPGPKAVVVTYIPAGVPSGPSYKIEIVGYASPMAAALAERRRTKKK